MNTRTKLKFLLPAAASIVALAAAACSAGGNSSVTPMPGTPKPTSDTPVSQPKTGKVSPTWVVSDMDMSGTDMYLSMQQVKSDGMVHFKVPVGNGMPDMTFMAYTLDGAVQVRSNTCVPCRSTSFSLDGNNLVCNVCDTIFDATTGQGISGACVNYPKDSVNYQLNGDRMIMKMMDLQTAYDNSVKPGQQ